MLALTGQWRWLDGYPWTYSNWSPSQPDNCCGGSHAAYLVLPWGNKWDDRWFTDENVCMCVRRGENSQTGAAGSCLPARAPLACLLLTLGTDVVTMVLNVYLWPINHYLLLVKGEPSTRIHHLPRVIHLLLCVQCCHHLHLPFHPNHHPHRHHPQAPAHRHRHPAPPLLRLAPHHRPGQPVRLRQS